MNMRKKRGVVNPTDISSNGEDAIGIILIDYDYDRCESRLFKDDGYSVRCVKDSE